MKNNVFINLLSLSGVIGVVFYFLHVTLGARFYEGYNPMAQAISDLTASNSPSKGIAMVFSILYGIFTVIFSIYFFVHFKQKINIPVTFGAGLLSIMTIVSFFGYTFFPLSESGYAGTFQDKMHILVTIAAVCLTVIALILFIIGFFGSENLKYPGILSLITFLLLLVGVVLMRNLPKEYFGIAERINVYSILMYIGILLLWMYIYTKEVNLWKTR